MRKKLMVGSLTAAGIAGSLSFLPSDDLQAPTRRKDIDHVGLYNFVVEIDGISIARFKNVSGLSTEVKVIEFQDGDDRVLRKRPGRSMCGNITLKKGYLATKELWDWWENIKQGQYDQRNIEVVLLDNMQNEVRRWSLKGCWPCKWKFADLDGKGDDIAAEDIEFVAEELFLFKQNNQDELQLNLVDGEPVDSISSEIVSTKKASK